jgi:hypothetical protein
LNGPRPRWRTLGAICRFRISEVLSVTALQFKETAWRFVLLTVVIVEWP